MESDSSNRECGSSNIGCVWPVDTVSRKRTRVIFPAHLNHPLRSRPMSKRDLFAFVAPLVCAIAIAAMACGRRATSTSGASSAPAPAGTPANSVALPEGVTQEMVDAGSTIFNTRSCKNCHAVERRRQRSRARSHRRQVDSHRWLVCRDRQPRHHRIHKSRAGGSQISVFDESARRSQPHRRRDSRGRGVCLVAEPQERTVVVTADVRQKQRPPEIRTRT